MFVAGAALILTRNIGIAIFAAMLTYSFLQKIGWMQGGTNGASASGSKESGASGAGHTGSARGQPAMSIEEAYRVLELKSGATRKDVLASYRNLITRNHPDQGGSTYIAAKVNEAKEVLLRHLGR